MRSKRYNEIKGKTVEGSLSVSEVIEKIKETATAKFDESVEISISLGINPSKSDQMVRGNVELPHGTGKEVKVAVVTKNDKDIKAAEEAGASIAGLENVLDMIKNGNLDFDVLIATPDCMKDLGKFGKMLGPKGLMPSPKSGTVVTNVAEAVTRIKKGQVEFKMDKSGVINGMIGKVSFPSEKLVENYEHYMETVKKSRPASAKGKFIKKVYVASTMGPSFSVSDE
ncbi:MAG: 50S ribosomal protein L1 [Elusimicrobiota bacterium]